MGPFHQWPTGSGFEYFYGFVGGETNQYYPGLFEGTTPVEPPKTPKRASPSPRTWPTTPSTGCASKSPSCRTSRSSLLRARRDPRAAPRTERVVEQYKGSSTHGWDLREDVCPQKALGVDPIAESTARHPNIPAWDDISAVLKPSLPARWKSTPPSWSRPTIKVGWRDRRSRGP